MAPVAPFFADWLFKNLNDATGKDKANGVTESVHLVDFPVANESAIDHALEERMGYAQGISSFVLSLRKKENIRVRQPLQKMLLPVLDETFQQQVEEVRDLILSEVNVKEIEYVTDTTGIIKKGIKPNFKTLGRRLGKNMKAVAEVINNFSQEDIATIEKAGSYKLSLDGETYDLTLEDFEIKTEDIPGWLVANDGPLTVALDVTITDNLLAEGTARELVNRIQNIRKNKDFNVTDKIVVTLQNHNSITSAVEAFGDYICNETLAVDLKLAESVNGEIIDLSDEVSLGIQVELNQ
jgi:isoleucyl-tRNA synthetase